MMLATGVATYRFADPPDQVSSVQFRYLKPTTGIYQAVGHVGNLKIKKLFVKPPSPLAQCHRPYPLPLKLVSTYIQALS